MFYITSYSATFKIVKFAYIDILDFPVQVEIHADPNLRRTSIVIGGTPHEEGSVYACSPAARMDGVQKGMPLHQAEQLSPRATFIPINHDRYDCAHKVVLDVLSPYSPFRESVSHGSIYLDATGLERLYGSDADLADRIQKTIREEIGYLSRIGIAGTKFAARIAAKLTDPGSSQVIQPGSESKFLAPLPIILLPSSDDTYRLLMQLGIETIGQLAQMPVGALARAFGKEGLKLHSLASGRDLRPLMPQFEAAPLSLETHLEFPLETLQQITAFADRLTSQLSLELQADSLVAGAMIVELEQEYGDELSAGGYLRPACSNHRQLADRANGLLSSLEYGEYGSGVVALKVGLFPLHPFHIESKQLGLFRPNSFSHQNPIQRVVGSIHRRFGDAAILQATEIESPPPEPISVRTDHAGFPTSFVRGNGWSRIATIDLHWRLEGDWWWGEGRKDYYKVATRKGEIRVLFHDSQADRWYLHSAAQPNSWPLT